jgi:glutamine synthetase
MRGKYMGRDKFFSALDKGFGFCDVVLGWDSNDQLYDNVKYTGWHTAYPDAPVRVLPDTCRAVPFEGDMVMFLGEFAEGAEAVCPRAVLRRVLKKAGEMGYESIAATEFEFFMFKETPESIREKGFRGLTTMTPGYFGYSVLRSTVHAEFYHQLMKLCTEMRMPLEGLHTETGPAQRNGMMATFMAKWSKDWPGQSGHVHTSLKRKADGKPAFHDASKPHNMSDEMRWYVGGQQS